VNYKRRIEDSGYNQKSLSKKVGISVDTLKRFIKDPTNKTRQYVKELIEPFLFTPEEIKLVGEKETLSSSVDERGNMKAAVKLKESAHGKSLEEMLELFNVDPNKWECTSYRANQWDVTAKIEGVMVTKTNYGAEAKFKPIHKIELTPEDIQWIFDAASEISNEPEFLETNYVETDNVLVLPIFDAHIGKLAWGKETGENYDIKIGVKRYKTAVKNLVERAHAVGISKIIFPVGNDYFQVDNDDSSTSKGTRVDSDIRWKKLFKIGVQLLRDTLDYCVLYAPVDVILVQGNHDNQMSFYAFEALRGYYGKHPFVEIDENIKTRTYRQIGVNLIGFTHGDKEKDRIYEIMQQEARELWGQTKYAEWIMGHFHRILVDEKQGVRKRIVSSITGKDAWHYESGYDSLTAAQGIIYNKKMAGPYVVFHISFEPNLD